MFLPPATLLWCHVTLQNGGFEPKDITGAATTSSGERIHGFAYLFLREAASQHLASKADPILEECDRPLGAYNWTPQEE